MNNNPEKEFLRGNKNMNDNNIKNSNGASCIFCKIGSREIPSADVYEDEKLFAFLDIHPVSKGHTLIIPKEHYKWMHETPDEIISEAFVLTKKLMNAIIKSLGCDYVQVSVVGKDVPHFHIHLIPKFLNDKIMRSPTTIYESEKEKQEFADKIKNSL